MEVKQSKFFVFTNFNLEEKYELWQAKYLCYGVEKCPDTSRIHHQGYVEFNSNQRLTALKKLSQTIHWENRRGTADQAIKYCEKDGDFHEFGQRPESKQGKRNDIEEVREMVKAGASFRDIAEVSSSFQALRVAEKLLPLYEQKRNWMPMVYWYWGPTGTGKSRAASEEAGENAYWCSNNSKWWQGYDGHENVIIDDFRGDWCKLVDLLKMLDRYPYVVECKGGSRQLLAKSIWITSAVAPEEAYRGVSEEKIDQLLRRIGVVKNFMGSRDGIKVEGNTSAYAPSTYAPGGAWLLNSAPIDITNYTN